MAHPLVERNRELARIGSLIRETRAGRGSVLHVEGQAGIGKTALVGATVIMARDLGLRVCLARGGELERDVAHGVVRQLFEGLLLRATPDRRAELLAGAARLAGPAFGIGTAGIGDPDGTDEATVLHGLYWLCTNLAAAGPVLVAVDDAHWADPVSLRFAAYLARRLADTPILLAVATRPAETEADRRLLDAIAAPSADRLVPAPLSVDGVRELLRQTGSAARQYCVACHEVTGGNPFLLRELVDAARADGIRPDVDGARRVRALGPPSVAAAVLRRLNRLPAPAVELARAVAVLGTGTAVRHAAALIGVDVETATRHADALAAVDILSPARPLDFVHPIVRRAVHDAIPAGERALAHGRAARILLDEGAPAERAAPHLMATEPAGDPTVVEVLRAAATRGAQRGAPDAAAAYLRRALAEPAPHASRADLLRELGRAEISAGEPDGVAHLQEALAAIAPGPDRAAVARELALGLVVPGRYLDAIAALEDAIAAIGDTDPERALLLTAELTTVAHMDPVTQPSADRYAARIPHDLAGDTPAHRVALASLSMQRLIEGASAAEIADLAGRAVRGGLIAEQTADFHVVYDALGTLWTTDAVDVADLAFTQALTDARARGSVLAFARASCFRSQFHYRLGRLPDAEADARASLAAAGSGWRIVHVALSALVDVLVERGELDEAEAALHEAGATHDLPYTFMSDFLLFSRGRLRLAQGRAADAAADLGEADRRESVWPGRSPAVFPIRSQLALARLALGDRVRAGELVAEENGRAGRFGTGYAVGVALRAEGLVAGGDDGIRLLTEAVRVLEASPARLEHARAATDLGAALRRGGHRTEATRYLSTGLDLASRCGATALADRARAELVAAGARPRRARTSGPPSLTASELRVARMAADGMSNREIAQALFVTLRTVELHLTHAYQKLGISSREQLATVLAG